MPASVPTLVPPQPVAASFGPVMENPFRLNEMFGAPNAMHGPPVTWQVTSPTSRESSDSIKVLTTTPLMSSAPAGADAKRAPIAMTPTTTIRHVLMLDHLHWMGRHLIQL